MIDRTAAASAELDASGLKCPLPVLRARKALRDVAAGATLLVRATDPAAPGDFAAFCDATGHMLVAIDEEAGTYLIRLRKRG
jgi:tRNA 2-thiouridine synthesizing protein A